MHIPLPSFLRRKRPTFPTPKDLPDLPRADAERALEALRRTILIDVARVYRAHLDHIHWQVYLDITDRRMTLAEWATEWLTKHPAPRSTLPPVMQGKEEA